MKVVRLTVPEMSIHDQTNSGEEQGQASSIDRLPCRELTRAHNSCPEFEYRVVEWKDFQSGKLGQMCYVYYEPKERAPGKEG